MWNGNDPVNHIIRKYTVDCKFTKSQEKIHHQIYMDDIKMFAKNEKRTEKANKIIRIYCQDIGIKLDVEKCSMLIMKSGK